MALPRFVTASPTFREALPTPSSIVPAARWREPSFSIFLLPVRIPTVSFAFPLTFFTFPWSSCCVMGCSFLRRRADARPPRLRCLPKPCRSRPSPHARKCRRSALSGGGPRSARQRLQRSLKREAAERALVRLHGTPRLAAWIITACRRAVPGRFSTRCEAAAPSSARRGPPSRRRQRELPARPEARGFRAPAPRPHGAGAPRGDGAPFGARPGQPPDADLRPAPRHEPLQPPLQDVRTVGRHGDLPRGGGRGGVRRTA